jgi:CheY-like chemotaxis protein/nitrogen-specific signal transduction histidine kinase
VAGFLSDIDDRKRAEIERERLLAALREADQRKNEFLAMLSHELRNPLAPIRNSLFVLGRATPGGPRATQALAVIDRQVEHMVRLVDDLLDVTRITRGKIRLQCEPMDLSDLVRRVAEDHRVLFAQSGVDLIVDVAPEARVIGDRTRLTQVVGNLLQNAAKFTPRGGSTTLSLMSEHGAQAILNVRDSGDGIAPAILPRLFTPFTQADTSLDRGKGGLGLGLSLVKSLVEMHGGSVAARSPGPGKGAEFRVTLPLEPNRTTEGRSSSGPLVRGLEPNRTAEGRSSSGPLVRGLERWPRREAMVATAAREGASLRVLLIEDNGDAAASLRVALEMGAHVVEIAGNGPDGIAKARSFRPDVVVCDIGLPGMDGYEVARAMRADADLSAMLLIALTGYAGPKDVARSREAGFDHHLAKPPDLATLRRLLGQVQRRAS